MMRKVQKQQLLDIITSMHLMHKEIQDRLKKKEYQAAFEGLQDCQAAAIQVGETIDNIAGEGTQAVTYLERYCESVYQVGIQAEVIQGQKAYKELEKELINAENAISHMEVKRVVVFLPYKASMWDSLESVWRASSEDEACESLVIPIPYFNKKEDGTIGEMVYEGDDFPKDVPITDWQQYSLEELHPDIIFIHNPYDRHNFVTTIHPYFYSYRIRKYTDKLVYIPYFVHANDRVQEDFCTLPGVLYADVVILQSEKVRKQYIQYFSQAAPDLVEALGQEAIEKKFLALGSPKFDKSTTNKADVPEEWKEFIAADEEKKIVFFNTHLSSLMKGKSEQFFRKLEWVFEFFKKRDDVVLLWRPHPLMEETAQSMNPEALEPYLALVNRYKKEKIGIYDDSKDMHRAIDLADAYYGDGSSVMEFFKQQGKPVMLMNHYLTE